MEMYSKRFDKTYEVESYTRDDGTQIASFGGLRALIEALGSAVTVNAVPLLNSPVIGFNVSITDDTGVSVSAYGSVNINAEQGVSKQRPLETAYSRAFSSAIIEYFGFPSRSKEEDAPQPEPLPAPAQKSAKEAAKETAKEKPANNDDPGEFVINFGNALRGKKVNELTESQLNWLAGDDFQPRNETAKKAKEAVKQFIAAKSEN